MLAVYQARKIKMFENNLEKFLQSLKGRELLRWGQEAWVLIWWLIVLILMSTQLLDKSKFYKINSYSLRNMKLILQNSYNFFLKIFKRQVLFYNIELRSEEEVLEWVQIISFFINHKTNRNQILNNWHISKL